MYGFDLWIKIAHLLFYLYSSGQFWQLKFSFIDQCSHGAHKGTSAHSPLHSRNDFWFHDWVRLGIITDVTISSKSQCPRQEVCSKTQSPFKEGRRRILGGSFKHSLMQQGEVLGISVHLNCGAMEGDGSLKTRDHRLKVNEERCLKSKMNVSYRDNELNNHSDMRKFTSAINQAFPFPRAKP